MRAERPRLQIVRGLPGSGKTTFALHNFPHLMRIETDMYFTRKGEYIFTSELNEKAVEWFNKTVREMTETGMDFVVTGVFAAHTERLANTIQAGLDNGYDVYIQTLTEDYGTIHNVPKEHYDSMKAAFVSNEEVQRIYRNVPTIHFGKMPTKSLLERLSALATKLETAPCYIADECGLSPILLEKLLVKRGQYHPGNEDESIRDCIARLYGERVAKECLSLIVNGILESRGNNEDSHI